MSKEILQVVEAVSNERGVSREDIFQALEAALAMAAKKRHEEDIEARVAIDRKTGEYETFRVWEILDGDEPGIEMENADAQLWLIDAVDIRADAQPGETIEEQIENVDFGRIAAQAAKQVIVQKVREAERAKVVEEYQPRIGELISGIVKRVERGSATVDIGGGIEAIVPREHMIPRDSIRAGDRLRGYLFDVRADVRGPMLFLSRTRPELLIELFRVEVPEIGEGLIELLAAARDPGSRAKIAVRSHDRRIDPVGACVGMRGSRVQAVSNELAGERVDIILWDDNTAQFVINAMAPAEVASIVMDEDSHSMDLAVAEEQLSKAIGRGGQNVRLASELSGWTLNVMSEEDFESKTEAETAELQRTFMEALDVDEDDALILVQEGFSSIEEVAYVAEEEMVQIEEFDADIVKELRDRARDVLLTQAIAQEEKLEGARPDDDLLNMEGMDERTAFMLAANGIVTREDLAEQATDDLMDIEDLAELGEERASALIMKAREIWFEESEEAGAN